METLTEVSFVSWAVPAPPAGASPLPAGGWAQPPSEGQTLALPPEVSMTFLVLADPGTASRGVHDLFSPRLQGLGAQLQP